MQPQQHQQQLKREYVTEPPTEPVLQERRQEALPNNAGKVREETDSNPSIKTERDPSDERPSSLELASEMHHHFKKRMVQNQMDWQQVADVRAADIEDLRNEEKDAAPTAVAQVKPECRPLPPTVEPLRDAEKPEVRNDYLPSASSAGVPSAYPPATEGLLMAARHPPRSRSPPPTSKAFSGYPPAGSVKYPPLPPPPPAPSASYSPSGYAPPPPPPHGSNQPLYPQQPPYHQQPTHRGMHHYTGEPNNNFSGVLLIF